jgi:vanadium chloroperoxidase
MQDSILFWNAVALEANRVSHSDPDKRQQNGPTLSSRAIAIVHLAMYDAYAGVAGFTRYLTPPPPPPPAGGSRRDAVAGAAHRTLSRLYSAQTEFFDAQLSCFNTADPSFAFGEAVGQALLDLRANDMDARSCGYMPSNDRGRHRVDPDNPNQGFDSPFYGAQTRTFAVKRRHDVDPPPFGDGGNSDYVKALRDVRARGIRPDLTGMLPVTPPLFDKRRNADQTLVGIYWGYDGANRLGTPPRFYNQIVREVAIARGNTEEQNARLFAYVNAALGDAGILCWEQKYCHDFWRPVLGIREHDETLGPAAPHGTITGVKLIDGDPAWLPLGAPSTNSPGMKNFTPNFPAYPSGHATFGAAALHITRMFYGIGPNNKSNDTLFRDPTTGDDLFLVSDEFNGGSRDNDGTVRPRHTRFFPGGLWEMIIENALSRIFLGVHWIFDAFSFTGPANGPLNPSSPINDRIGGVGLGLRIARDIFAHGGGAGGAPKMTPVGVNPPITTPAPGPSPPPLPVHPAQPTLQGNCIGNRSAKKSSKKGTAKDAAKKKTAKSPASPEMVGQQQPGWPSGLSEQGGEQPGNTGPGAWPSGISEK